MIVDSLAEVLALPDDPLPIPRLLPDAPQFRGQSTGGGSFVPRWVWADGRHLSLGVVAPSAVAGTEWEERVIGGRVVYTSGPGDPRGGQRAYAVIDGAYVAAGGSLPPDELAAIVATTELR